MTRFIRLAAETQQSGRTGAAKFAARRNSDVAQRRAPRSAVTAARFCGRTGYPRPLIAPAPAGPPVFPQRHSPHRTISSQMKAT
ncbi:hypothetical protein BC834DRAFT_891856 [Gloeopeniophorella convolvens]|nr:hypothetical protein BC834DRAFT_891856 [Gloeopeniophorella convolvens]